MKKTKQFKPFIHSGIRGRKLFIFSSFQLNPNERTKDCFRNRIKSEAIERVSSVKFNSMNWNAPQLTIDIYVSFIDQIVFKFNSHKCNRFIFII